MFPNEKNTVLGPGKLLQIAREEKNLRPEDVAYEIRLTPSQVLALDEDDYSRMPEETYVRGYLRNYARLVGVPENDILMAFARMTRARDAVPAAVSAHSPAEIESGRPNSMFLMIAAISIIAAIALGAFLYLQPDKKQPGAAVVADSAETEIIAEKKPLSEEVPVGTSTLTFGQPAVDTDSKAMAAVSPATGNEPDNKSGINKTGVVAAPEIIAGKNNAANGQQTVATLPVTGQAASGAEISAAAATAVATGTEKTVASPGTAEIAANGTSAEQAAAGGGRLLIHYSKDSWTDIRDANGKKLLYRTVKAGEKIALAGDLPISLFFGFAQGVEVKFNGVNIDIPSHTRGVFARFTVGEAVSP